MSTSYIICLLLVLRPRVQMSHALNMTTIMSLLQPSPEVFELFDDLMLLVEGKVLYHGPLQDALPHFTNVGFVCPVRKDVASFLLEITTPSGVLRFDGRGWEGSSSGSEACNSSMFVYSC